MKKKFNELINNANSKRNNTYYKLNQLPKITGLSIRMLKYKMVKIKEKYAGVTSLLEKDGKQWKIHYSIINEFMPINKRKTYTENNYDWQSFVSWNPFENYDKEYHQYLIYQIKNQMPDKYIKYTIELDGRGYNHVHFITDAQLPEVKTIVENVIYRYFSWNEISFEATTIINKYSSVNYTNKAPIITEII
ncbi:hypothetical protein [Flavobacterium aquicola]|uniref:Uncharacterized protein n=1 Tax=Flavobacterium aquicola TaxID=1682742 RepID=A0A3E0EAW2_9FLAO|nr:hypothetical protein [Flavobacterium aquicola]REG94156.1 hypothetical protein C8P67_113132 [Flavobacterium aquicola]